MRRKSGFTPEDHISRNCWVLIYSRRKLFSAALAISLMKTAPCMRVCVCAHLCFPSAILGILENSSSFLCVRFFLCEQLPADLNKMHLTDHAHQQVMHMAPSQSGCSITSDSGSSSLSDIYQVGSSRKRHFFGSQNRLGRYFYVLLKKLQMNKRSTLLSHVAINK